MDPRLPLTQAVEHIIGNFFRENRRIILESLEQAKTSSIFATVETFPLKVKFDFVLWVAHGAVRAINSILFGENIGMLF